MTSNLTRTVARNARRIVGGSAAVAAAGISLVAFTGATPQASAAPSQNPNPLRHGIVHVNGSLTGRSFPTTHSEAGPSFRNGTRIDIDCKVRGTDVGGNTLWYGIPITGNGRIWVSARYVDNSGPAPEYCNPSDGFFAGTAHTTVNQRKGPSVSDAKVGSSSKGQRVNVSCYVGPSGSRWYYTDRDRWLDARYVSVSSKVSFCANR